MIDSNTDTESRPRRARTRRTRSEETDEEPKQRTRRSRSNTEKTEEEPKPRTRRSRSRPTVLTDDDASADDKIAELAKQLDAQAKKIEKLTKAQEELQKSIGDSSSAKPLPRVGVFVDSANIELAIDRMKRRVDWKEALAMLTKDRQLVRAVAYSPVHDDPDVSMETQRFVEPFLDADFKIVSKPLKRFADGSIKANVDIELALDIMSMIDRLDVVCLVSGDGDFTHLVEVIQERGVRVEVVSVGASTAGQLRKAADHFVDLDQVYGGGGSRAGSAGSSRGGSGGPRGGRRN